VIFPQWLELFSGNSQIAYSPVKLDTLGHSQFLAEATFDDSTTTGTVYANADVGHSGKPSVPTGCGWNGHNVDPSIVLNSNGGSSGVGTVDSQSTDFESGNIPETGEVIILNKVESPVEQQLLRTYLNQKWGAISLGANF
jgi:hypothetical protein